jgi:hypothetical protein
MIVGVYDLGAGTSDTAVFECVVIDGTVRFKREVGASRSKIQCEASKVFFKAHWVFLREEKTSTTWWYVNFGRSLSRRSMLRIALRTRLLTVF